MKSALINDDGLLVLIFIIILHLLFDGGVASEREKTCLFIFHNHRWQGRTRENVEVNRKIHFKLNHKLDVRVKRESAA